MKRKEFSKEDFYVEPDSCPNCGASYSEVEERTITYGLTYMYECLECEFKWIEKFNNTPVFWKWEVLGKC